MRSKQYAAGTSQMERIGVVRTARITVETDTVIVVRQAKTACAWCPKCGAEVEVITLEIASITEEAATAQLQEWLSTGKLHLWQIADGPAQICLASLLQCFELDVVPRTRITKEEK